jgi:hypothetical protein
MRCRAFLCVVACLVTSLPFAASAFAADEMHLSGPVVHDNLAIYFVHGSASRGAVPLSLQEALAKGSVRVEETGSVNALTIENVGDSEVFVQAGDIVKGGQQDRVLSVDLLLPPRSGRLSIAAFCVEAARWSARGVEDERRFSTASAAIPSHEAKLAMRVQTADAAALPARGPAAAPVADNPTIAAQSYGESGPSRQDVIWKTVKSIQERLSRSVGAPVASPTSPSSLQLSLENDRLKQAQQGYVTALAGAGETGNDVVGYVVAINGKITGGDVYASNELLRKMWRKQLEASVTEAISKKDVAGAAAAPAATEVEAFLASADAGAKTERAINANVTLATRDSAASLYAETRRPDGSWVHRNYLAR